MADKLVKRETSPLLNSANSQLFVARYVDVVNKLLKVERRELSTPFFSSITMESEGVKKWENCSFPTPSSCSNDGKGIKVTFSSFSHFIVQRTIFLLHDNVDKRGALLGDLDVVAGMLGQTSRTNENVKVHLLS